MSNRFLQIKATRHPNQNLRLPAENVRPGNPNRISTFSPEFVPATRYADHFRHPVPAAINWVQPFHAENPGPVRQRVRHGGDSVQMGSPTIDQRFRLLGPTGGGAQLAHVVEYLIERFRGQPKNLRLVGKRVQHLRNFISRRRTNLAEVLRQDQIGGEFAQKLLVHTIDALSLAQPFTDGSVDFLIAHISLQSLPQPFHQHR